MSHSTPAASPDRLVTSDRRAAGGRRLNRVPLLGVLLVGALVVGAMGYTYQQRLAESAAAAPHADSPTPEPATAAAVLGNAPTAGLIGPRPATTPTAPAAPPATPTVTLATTLPQDQPPPAVNGPRAADPPTPEQEARRRAWEQYEQERRRIEQQRRDALRAALDAPTTVGAGRSPGSAGQTAAEDAGLPPAAGGAGVGPAGLSDDDPNKQAAKRSFLAQRLPPPSHYLAATREAALSPHEIKAGTVIPSVMISGINSDLPGQIIAQVSENVYDSATGRYLLIPQGARLVGTYDNGVSLGQERVLIAWNRVIYPDSSSLDLGVMPGADQAGYGGFQDKVNNHYVRVFGNALLISLFAAGIQLSQPQAQAGDHYSSPQIIAGSLGQQMGQLGSEIARRGIHIAPTLEIRPGYKFNVMVTKDVVLEPWERPAS